MPKQNSSEKYFMGFMSYSSHDPSAAILRVRKSSRTIHCDFVHFEEGMLSRKKKSYHFPTRSISECLDYFEIKISEVDQVVTDFMDNKSFVNTSSNYRHLVGDFIRNNIELTPDQISECVDHHYAHAMAAWVGSGFEDCAFLAIDGLGSLQSTHSVFVTSDGKLEKIFTQTTPGIGSLYSLVTELIGFKVGEEGKTMGLAPYGRDLSSSNLYPQVNFKGVYNSLSVDYSSVVNRSPNKYLLTDFNFKNFEKVDIYRDYRAYLAFCIQEELEKCLIHLSKEIKAITGKKKLCISGGVALNCVMNEILASSNIFDSIYVFPDSADSGLAVGLVFSAAHQYLSNSEWQILLKSYKHPKFAPQKAVPNYKSPTLKSLPWQTLNLDSVITELERDACIAIMWQGFEYGPRALGHRSFIAKANSPKMKEILNTKIKHREAYRPFAPICLQEDFSMFFDSLHNNHEYMSYAVKTRPIASHLVPAIVHYDNTARVQVAHKDCGIIYQLLLLMKEKSGFGLLINTSFNDNDEPIVLDELDAVSCFLRTNCDLLIINEKMLFRNSIEEKIEFYFKNIAIELNDRNNKRFQKSIKSILKSKTSSLWEHLSDYNTISKYHQKFATQERFHKLITEIKTGKKSKFKRLIISKKEFENIENLLCNYYANFDQITNEIIEVHDSASTVKLLKPGDFILSYNLSNILRDYDNLGKVKLSDYEIFYKSSDFPLPNVLKPHQDINATIKELSNTYEQINSLEIDTNIKNIILSNTENLI